MKGRKMYWYDHNDRIQMAQMAQFEMKEPKILLCKQDMHGLIWPRDREVRKVVGMERTENATVGW